ncbi:MAG: heme exporter protein CcmD [Gammaproteobacteria bacterium]|tara:strand:- start:86 stop:259 length:174 start_codon:yes stop_codon:yes gene_type:complete
MMLNDFFYMGGYGIYVWSAYAITAIVLIFNLILIKKKEKKILYNLRKLKKIKDNNEA